MRIKRLELTGFKSSKDRTVLELPDGITGIVGPNGCGKSNIVDALRWVLGEQSARHLRGRSMEDVIFAGNQHHGPLGMAEVTVVLDNEGTSQEPAPDGGDEDNEVVRALRRVPELQVTRRLYRSGESEYEINGRSCRLRDITELFLGTGVGTKAYSIVEQGRVGQIVGAKPEELRLFIEEAAGTTLYRSRKISAERKIERTRDNLLRVSDIVRELERQANSLRRQAKGAVQYQELRAQEDSLDRGWTALRFRAVDHQRALAEEHSAEWRGREHALRLKVDGHHHRRERLRGRVTEAESAREIAGRELFEARNALSEAEQEKRHLQQRRGELEGLLREAAQDVEQLDTRGEALREQVRSEEERRDQLARDYNAARAASDTIATRVRECDDRYLNWSSEADTLRTSLIEALGASAALRNERAAIARQVEAGAAREGRLRTETEALATVRDRLQGDLAETDRRLADLAAQLESAEAEKRGAAEELQAVQASRDGLQADVERWREECAMLRSRLESLEELQRTFAGYNDGVRAFMSNGGRERAGAQAVVADLIEIEPGFERAVAAAVGGALQYIVVPTTDSGIEGARYLRENSAGRATFLPMQTGLSSTLEPGTDRLSDHVRVRQGFEDVVTPLLSGCAVVDDLDHVQALRTGHAEGLACVTRDGQFVSAVGLVTGGSENPVDEGLLLRSSEARRVRESLAVAERSLLLAQEALRSTTESAAETDARLADLDRAIHGLAVERVRWMGEKRLHEQNGLRTEERLRAVELELDGVQREMSVSRSRLEESQGALDEKESEAARLESARARVEETGRALEAARRQALTELEHARVSEAESRQKIEGAQAALSALALSVQEVEGRREALLARVDRSRLEITSLAVRIDDPALDPENHRRRMHEAEERLAGLDRAAAAVRTSLGEVDRILDALSSRQDSVREEFGRSELQRKQLELEAASILEGASERLGIGAAELALVNLPESSVSELAVELEAVRGRIRRLGTVNLGAIAELEEIEARLAELCGQRDDLERSIEDLRGTIARLNRMSRQRFLEAFQEVNRVFQATFPKLFQGGKAWLALTDPENLLETGVEIFVQPPGKRLGNLDLLSGGEKAMTAISLIFALFLYKPSPFCVLDEVDAPLDEANIGRFTRIVAEMCDRSQFLLITHNKRTMEICDSLYGVTMPEPGVSRMVSVDLSQAA